MRVETRKSKTWQDKTRKDKTNKKRQDKEKTSLGDHETAKDPQNLYGPKDPQN